MDTAPSAPPRNLTPAPPPPLLRGGRVPAVSYGLAETAGAVHTARLMRAGAPPWPHPLALVPYPRGALSALTAATSRPGGDGGDLME
eukprot:1192479-Prorocentrum_minimum.AAC.6